MGISCANIPKDDVKELNKRLIHKFDQLNIRREDLTQEEAIAVLTKLSTSTGLTLETLMKVEHKNKIANAIAEARNAKIEEKQALENNKVGKATFKIVKSDKWTKASVRQHQEILFIFDDNLQASNTVFGETIGDALEVEGGVKLAVRETSSLVRTDTNGDINSNAVGIVTKKNAQNSKGIFIQEEGFFQDTDADFDMFVKANERAIAKIKKMLFAEDSAYKNVSMLGSLASEKSSLPKRFAEKLRDMLNKELGIMAQVIKNDKGGYMLEIQPLGNPKSTNSDSLTEKQKEAIQKINEIFKSLQKERPLIDPLEVIDDKSILAKVYPQIEQRIARVAFVSEKFSSELNTILDRYKAYYESRSDRTEDEEFYYEGLTKGTREQQKVFALGHLTVEGLPLASYILNNIKKQLTNVITQGKTKDGYEALVNILIEGKGEIGKNFHEELLARGIPLSNVKVVSNMAAARINYLVEEYEKMLYKDNEADVFAALCEEAAYEIEFNENIRLNFIRRPITETDEIHEDLKEEDKENANKEGYMIKYKLMDPAKTLTLNIKTLLSSLYKRDPRNPEYHVFNDLGNKVRMDALVAYKILLDEFAPNMKSPEDFTATLDKCIVKYPWLASIRDLLVFNPKNHRAFNEDLRNEFFGAMRKAQVPYGVISPNGLMQRLNRSTSAAAVLDNIKRNYEGRVVLSKTGSIYTETGECNKTNCLILEHLFKIDSGSQTRIQGPAVKTRQEKAISFFMSCPLGWSLRMLKQSRVRNGRITGGIVKNLVTALQILSGVHEVHGEKAALETVLQKIGIDTNKMHIDSLFGDIPFMEDEDLENIKSLDDLQEIISGDQINGLIKALESIEIIVSKYDEGMNLVSNLQAAYLRLASALTLVADGYTSMTFRHGDTTRATYAAPDFISDLVDIIHNTDNIEAANAWIEENYGKYDFFKNQSLVNAPWLNQWLEDFFYTPDNGATYPYRDGFEYINLLSLMGSEEDNLIGNVSKNNLLSGIIHAYFSANNDSGGRTFGYYRCPLFADVDACVVLKGRRYTGEGYKDAITTNLVKVILQEVNRIRAVNKSSADPNAIKVEYYNEGKTNGSKFQYFPEFNDQELYDEIFAACTPKTDELETSIKFIERRDKQLKEIVSRLLEEKAKTFIESVSPSFKTSMYRRLENNEKKKNNTTKEDQTLTVIEVDKATSAEELKEINETQSKQMDERLIEFYYNDFFAQSQIQQLLGGDLAFYKNFTDYVKRNKQAYACGEKLFAKETNEKGEIVGDLVETAIYLEDADIMSNSYESLKNLLISSDMTDVDKAQLRYVLESYKKITSTDGQSLRTLNSFRKIFKAKGGTWTDEMERAYQNITKHKTITAKDFLSLWNPIKPFYFGYESLNINGRQEKVITQHKNSEYMITALYSFLNTALNKSPKLVGLHKFMDAHNIDVVHFHSVVKEGYNTPFSLNHDSKKYDEALKQGKITLFGKPFTGTHKEYMKKITEALENGTISQESFNKARQQFDHSTEKAVVEDLEKQYAENPNKSVMLKQFSMDSYMIVQPSGDHLIDEDAILGTQAKNIIMADLPSDFSMTVTIKGKEHTMNREEAVKLYNTLLVDNLLDSFSEVSKEFTDIHSLQKALFAKMQNNPKYGKDVKDALQINEDGTGFMMPFNSPTLSNKIEELMLSTFKNTIQRQKIRGGNAVLVSNFGLHDDLHVVYKDGKDGSKGIEYIECYLPAAYSDMYKDFLRDTPEGYQIIDFEAMEKALDGANSKEILDIIGYRIPTEDKYSMMPIRIKGFMPVTAGSTIMLPTDIITMSGTDFDIDKLFLMMKEFDRIMYPRELYDEFKKYIENNKNSIAESDNLLRGIFGDSIDEALEEEDNQYAKLGRILKWKHQGYSEKDVEILVNSNDTFAEFMEEVGDRMAFEKPRYKVLRPRTEKKGEQLSLDDISKQSFEQNVHRRIAIRNNMIIDMMWQVLTSEEVSKLMMQPGNFDRVRHSSRQQKIMHNPKALASFVAKWKEFKKAHNTEIGLYDYMNSQSTEQLEKFYEENADIISPLDIIDYVNMQKNLMDGNALIGMFAVNSSNHYKLQFLPITIAEDYQITINGVTITNIDLQNSPITGERIGRINAEFQAASPDNGKDPCLGDIGANASTASKIGFLARIGLTPQMIGILNTCDDFFEYSQSIYDKVRKETAFPKVKDFNIDFNKLTELIALFRADKEVFEKQMLDTNNRMFVAMFSEVMGRINKLSAILGKVSKVSRVDSPNGALAVNIPNAIQQHYGAKDFIKEVTMPNCPIKGLDKLINIDLDAGNMQNEEYREIIRKRILEAPVPRLQAAYTLGIKSGLSLCQEWFPGLSDQALEIFEILREEVKNPLTSKKNTTLVRKFIGELTQAILSGEKSIFATDEHSTIMEKRNYYIHDFPMKFKAFLEEKDEEGNLKYPEVVNSDVIRRLTNLDQKGIKFKSINGISDRDRKHYIEEFEALLDSDKQEVRDIAQDLFMYSYFDNGFQFSHNNFGILFTTKFLKKMPKFISALNEGNANILNSKFPDYQFVYQYMLNHPELCPKAKYGTFKIQGKYLFPTKEKVYNYMTSSPHSFRPIMFIQYNGKLYKKVEDNSKLYYEEYDNYNKTTIPFYDLSEDFRNINFSDLQGRGRIGYIAEKGSTLQNLAMANGLEDANIALQEFQEQDIQEIKERDIEKDLKEIKERDIEEFKEKEEDLSPVASTLEDQELPDALEDTGWFDTVDKDMSEPAGLKREAAALENVEQFIIAEALDKTEQEAQEKSQEKDSIEIFLNEFPETEDPNDKICK